MNSKPPPQNEILVPFRGVSKISDKHPRLLIGVNVWWNWRAFGIFILPYLFFFFYKTVQKYFVRVTLYLVVIFSSAPQSVIHLFKVLYSQTFIIPEVYI